jgi:N-acetylglucosaminyldiphosphoundecaprenol N-acetyl-beta-D-mannosaminyltransferase
MSRIELLGLPVDALDMEATLQRIETFVESGTAHQHVVVNAAKIVQAQDDPDLARVIGECDLINVDGMAVVWAGRLLGRRVPERVAGIDLMDNLLARAAQCGWRVYFLGARADVAEELVRREQRAHPGLVVAGFRNGFWQPHEEHGVVEAIAATKPDILLVAMSSPKKEQFLSTHKARLAVPFVMGVGGSFDVVAGRVSRAPRWMQRVGLEWLHRLMQEPRRLAKRYVVGNTRFIVLVVSHWRGRK